MQDQLFIAFVPIFVVTFFLFIGFIGFFLGRKLLRQDNQLNEINERISKSEKFAMQEEMASMKHRLVVLEKIVTDRGYQVDEEIEQLRSIK